MTLEALFALVLSFALLTKGGPVEPEYDVTHIQTANDCPPYDSYGYRLLARKLGCNDDKPMHCAYLLGSERFTVRCLKPKLCTQGQQPFIQDRSDTVSCGFCSGDTYHSVPSQPSYSYSKCTPMTKLTKGRISCEHLELRTSDPDYHKYNRYIRCNTLEGYILEDQSVSDLSRDRLGYCTNATDPRCIKYSCKEGLELIKNYSCVKNCSSDEYRGKNFTCVKRQAGPSTTPGSPVVTIDRSSTQPVTQTTEPMKSGPIENTEALKVLFGIFVGVISIVAAVFCWCKRDRIRQCWQNLKDRIRQCWQNLKGFPHGRQSSVDHSLHEVHSDNDQPNTITDDSGDRAKSSPLLSEEIHLEHADQPNQAEDPLVGSRDDNTDDHQEKRPLKTIINDTNSQYIGKQVVIYKNYCSHGKEWEKTKDGKGSEEKSDSDKDRSKYKHPTPVTEADYQQLNHLNLDNLDRSSKSDGNISRTERHNHEPEVKFGIPVASEISEPCIRTLDDLNGKLQRAGSPEEKVDISLEVFRKLREEGHSWNTFHCCCNLIHEKDFPKEMLPDRKVVPCKPDSPTKEYCNTPKGFTAFVSTGDYNSCLYQSVSLLLGKESLYKLLRLMTAVFAARNFDMAAKQIMSQLNYEEKDVHHFYIHHLDKKAYEELHAKEQHEQNIEEWNKIYLQELIMETPVLNRMSSQIHAMFLCGAIKRPIRQYLQAEHKDYMFHDELDPKACFNDGSYDESLPDLCIMWVNNENDPNKDINHVVPLWKEEEEEFHCVRQPAEATAVKSIMATQEDTKHNTEKSDDDTDKNDYKRDADNYDDDEDVDDDDEKDQLL